MTTKGRTADRNLSLYCQAMIQSAMAQGREGRDIASAAGVSPSLISQVKSRGEGVGLKAAAGFAKAFGMTLGDFMAAADAWGKGRGDALATTAAFDPRALTDDQLAEALAEAERRVASRHGLAKALCAMKGK